MSTNDVPPNAHNDASVERVRYRGVNRRGRVETGTISGGRERVAWWVKVFFDKGYRALVVTIDEEEVGCIWQQRAGGPRSWWADCDGAIVTRVTSTPGDGR